jgi:hypothetical protein
MRVFEKTFGIDQLNAMVKKLEHQRKVRETLLIDYRLRSTIPQLVSSSSARMI